MAEDWNLSQTVKELKAENKRLLEQERKCLDKIGQLITENARLRTYVGVMAGEADKHSQELQTIKSMALDA